jgi:hypothetical protein
MIGRDLARTQVDILGTVQAVPTGIKVSPPCTPRTTLLPPSIPSIHRKLSTNNSILNSISSLSKLLNFLNPST